MAGQGYRLFNTGDVLTAAQVNTYLQEQVVMVFADATARTTALSGVLAEGMITYLKDTNAVEKYDGASWSAIGTGDIEGVTAGVGISGGGTSGTVTITNSMATAIDAKGDLIAGTGADTFSKITVGANDTVLTADSSTATGLKWAAVTATANEAVGYKWDEWNPTNNTGTETNAGTGSSSGNTTNISVSNSSGTLTVTFAATGFYSISVSGSTSISFAYTDGFNRFTFGGTATRWLSIASTNKISQWGEGDGDGDWSLQHTFLVNATAANQTLTILPSCRINGPSAVSGYDFYATATIVRM